MPYKFNPFTQKLDLVELGDPTPAFIEVTGNDSVVVPTDSNSNINVLGDNTTGINTTGNVSNHTLTIQGLTSSTSQIGTTAYATNIQASEQASDGVALTPSNITSFFSNNPLPITQGGTGDTNFTPYSVICGGITSTDALQSVSSLGSSGQVLTSNGASNLPTWEDPSSGGSITTIAGDTGTATGSTVTFNSSTNCGSTVIFSASGSTASLKITDSNYNTIMGQGAGNSSIVGSYNTAFAPLGFAALTTGEANTALGTGSLGSITTAGANCAIGYGSIYSLISGNSNVALGYLSGFSLTTGTRNICIGTNSAASLKTGNDNIVIGYIGGNSLVGSESSNIYLGNNISGSGGENNTLRIGTNTGTGTGQLNKTFISGINGIAVSGNAILVSSSNQLGVGTVPVSSGGSGSTSFNANGVVISGNTSTSNLTSLSLSSGQIVIGGSGAPSAATLSAGTGINISNGNNSITINSTGGGLSWIVTSTTSASMTINTGYTANNASLVTLTLPVSSSVGDTIVVTGLGSGGWSIAQNSGQTIHVGSLSTTTGIGGSITSTNQYDSITITCVVDNTTWVTRSSIGNLIVV